MPQIVHFEIHADDVERARHFYGELFGWKIEKYPGPFFMDYWMIATAAEGEKALEGGMMQRQHPQQTITIYIDVPSVEDYLAKVTSLGGQVAFPKMAVPGMGYFAVCLDPENNQFALWENDSNAR